MTVFITCVYDGKFEFVFVLPLWSSGQSSWFQIQRFKIDSYRYQNFLEVVCLEQDPLILVSAIEELLERKIAALV
jgi:hypothetical protein